jgi:hypothetical protein
MPEREEGGRSGLARDDGGAKGRRDQDGNGRERPQKHSSAQAPAMSA